MECLGLPHAVGRGMALNALLVVAAMACDASSSALPVSPIVSDSAGIVSVSHLNDPADTLQILQPAVRIGLIDGPVEFLFQDISDAAVFGDSLIAVVDRGGRVALFDLAGSWRGDFGAKGEGPGEYMLPTQLWTVGDTLILWDAGRRRILRFLVDGSFLGGFTIDKPDRALPIAPYLGGFLDLRERGQLADPEPARGSLVILSSDGTLGDTVVHGFPVPEYGWQVIEGTNRGYMVNPPVFSVYPSWAVAGEAIVWSLGVSPAFEILGPDGAIRRVVRWPDSDRWTSDRDRDAFIDALNALYPIGDESAVREARARTVFAEQRPTISRIVVDGGGRIWVANHDPSLFAGIGSLWRRFDKDGLEMTLVQFPQGFVLLSVGDSTAVGVSTIAAGVQVIDVFSQ